MKKKNPVNQRLKKIWPYIKTGGRSAVTKFPLAVESHKSDGPMFRIISSSKYRDIHKRYITLNKYHYQFFSGQIIGTFSESSVS